MLSSISLGFPTVERYAPLGRAFGDYTETTTQTGSCGGADFRCSARPEDGGLFSCRPCTTAVLLEFKAFQEQLNRLAAAAGVSVRLLKIDGRVGSLTAGMLGRVAKLVAGRFPPPAGDPSRAIAAAMSSPSSEATMRAIAKVVPQLRAWADGAATALKAPKTIPVPLPPPPGGATGPATPVVTVPPSLPTTTKRRTGVVVGALAGLTAIGLVAAAVKMRRS